MNNDFYLRLSSIDDTSGRADTYYNFTDFLNVPLSLESKYEVALTEAIIPLDWQSLSDADDFQFSLTHIALDVKAVELQRLKDGYERVSESIASGRSRTKRSLGLEGPDISSPPPSSPGRKKPVVDQVPEGLGDDVAEAQPPTPAEAPQSPIDNTPPVDETPVSAEEKVAESPSPAEPKIIDTEDSPSTPKPLRVRACSLTDLEAYEDINNEKLQDGDIFSDSEEEQESPQEKRAKLDEQFCASETHELEDFFRFTPTKAVFRSREEYINITFPGVFSNIDSFLEHINRVIYYSKNVSMADAEGEYEDYSQEQSYYLGDVIEFDYILEECAFCIRRKNQDIVVHINLSRDLSTLLGFNATSLIIDSDVVKGNDYESVTDRLNNRILVKCPQLDRPAVTPKRSFHESLLASIDISKTTRREQVLFYTNPSRRYFPFTDNLFRHISIIIQDHNGEIIKPSSACARVRQKRQKCFDTVKGFFYSEIELHFRPAVFNTEN